MCKLGQVLDSLKQTLYLPILNPPSQGMGGSGFGKFVWDPLQGACKYFTVSSNTSREERKSCEMFMCRRVLQRKKKCTRPTHLSQGEHDWRVISSIMQEEMQAAVWADVFFSTLKPF